MSIKTFVKKRPKVVILAVVGTILLLCAIAGIIVWQVVDWDKDSDNDKDNDNDNDKEIDCNDFVQEPSPSELGRYSQAAVSTDSPHCSDIGRDMMLERNGSVVDAAIAAALCVGVIQGQSMGIGGGFLAIYYNATTGKSRALNARERAPYNATEDMFEGDPSKAARGPLAVAVPGELKGYRELHNAYGKLPWSELFQPSIKLAEEGFQITGHAANALAQNSARILTTPSMAEVFVNNATGQVFREGDTIRRPVLANTLKELANNPDSLYEDTPLMRNFVDDLQAMEGIITYEDMLNYTATWEDNPVEVDIAGDYKLHSVPPPGSGILLAFVMRLLSNFEMKNDCVNETQRIVEAFKHAYAKRTLLGDPIDPEVMEEVEELRRNLTESTSYLNSILSMIHEDRTNNTYEYYGAEFYQPNDHGTSHLSLVGPNGDAIALTASVNL